MLSVARLRAERCACFSQVVSVNANILSRQICPWRTTFAFLISEGFTANIHLSIANIAINTGAITKEQKLGYFMHSKDGHMKHEVICMSVNKGLESER